MPSSCPLCGALLHDDSTCRSVFEQFLTLEFSDPAYGAVHFLTVSCYMIQHAEYTPSALAWIEGTLRDYLDKGLTPQQLRRQVARQTDPHNRKWKVNRSPGDPPQPQVAWSMTIMDVADHYHNDPSTYCQLITQWARLTLRDMQPLISSSRSS